MLDILGLILLIVITIFVYKTAKDYERNAIVWALITIAVGICFQIVLPIFIYIIFFVVGAFGGSSAQQIEDSIPIFSISIAFKLLSLVACFLILRHVATIPEEKTVEMPPLPPSDFNQNI